jgi:hypothetical protein
MDLIYGWIILGILAYGVGGALIIQFAVGIVAVFNGSSKEGEQTIKGVPSYRPDDYDEDN